MIETCILRLKDKNRSKARFQGLFPIVLLENSPTATTLFLVARNLEPFSYVKIEVLESIIRKIAFFG